jgi:hypothetical protein
VHRTYRTSSADVQERLRRLEEAVFGAGSKNILGQAAFQDRLDAGANLLALRRLEQHSPDASLSPLADAASTAHRKSRPARAVIKELDYSYSGDCLASDHSDPLILRVAPARHRSSADGTPSSETTDHTLPGHHGSLDASESVPRYIWLPNRQDAIALFRDYLDTSNYLQPRFHEPSTRAMFAEMYSRLSHGQKVDLSCVALMLTICAAAAYYWDNTNGSPSYTAFNSTEEAARQSLLWRKMAWDLLDQSHRATASAGSLEEVQARIILADLIYNMEGCSGRYRTLQASALAMSREISLHLVDLPGTGQDVIEGQANIITREIKRRVWWHVASTDW